MKQITLTILTIIVTLHTTNAGWGFKVKDIECDEVLKDPDYNGKRCTVTNLVTKGFAFNWYKLEYTELVFINATLPFIPTDLDFQMGVFELVNLTGARLKFIDKNNFKEADKLIEMYLAENELYEIPANTFEGATALELLDISNNQIEKVAPTAFSGLKNLIKLNLNGNNIRTFDFSQLSDLVKLKHLDIGYNDLMEIDITDIKKHLPQLEWIGLRGNNIDCSHLYVLGQKLRDVSIFTDVVDDLTGAVLPNADCVKPTLGEMLFD